MPVKTGPPKNIVEQAEGVASNAWERTGEIVTDTAKTVVQDAASQASWESWLGLEETLSDEAVEAKEDEEFLRKLDGYKDIFRKIDVIEGRVTDERVLDEKVQRYIEEEKKRAAEGLREMKTEHKMRASELGTAPQSAQQQAQAERQGKLADEEEQRRKAEKHARLDNVVEAPGKVTGLPFGNRKRTATRMMRPPKSAESKIGRGVGG